MRDFADDNPHIGVTLLRFANVLGDDIDTPFSLALRRRLVPEIFGFDPRMQFVHEDDVVDALMYATTNDVPGVYNVAGDGTCPGARSAPSSASADTRCRSCSRTWSPSRSAPPGRGICRRRRCSCCATAARSTIAATSAPGSSTRTPPPDTVEAFAQGLRLAGTVGDKHPSYRYEREVEDFFRHSPAVVRPD